MSVLDRNLTELLRRHRAVTADAQWRQRLEARFVAEALDAAQPAAPHSPPAPVLRPRFGSPLLRREVRRAGLLAAAGVLAMLGTWWLATEGGPPRARLDEALAASGAALRASEDGEWRATPDSRFDLPGDFLELAGAGGRELDLRLPDLGGEVALLAGEPARASFARVAGDVRVTLLAGHGVVRRTGAPETPLVLGHALLLGREPAAPDLPEPGAGAPRPLEPVVQAPADVPFGPGELHGVVVRAADGTAAGGTPVTDFLLILSTTDVTSQGARTFAREIHAADGRFRLSPPAGRWHLFVQAEGFATRMTRNVTIDPRLTLPDVRVELERGVTVSGRVLDAGTGAPIAGALVLSDTDAPAIMVALKPEHLRGELPMDVLRNRALTEADGSFALPGLSSAGQVLRASAPGFGPTWLELPPGPAQDATLRLQPGGSVAGRVMQDDGTPWANSLMVASFNCPEPAGRVMAIEIAFTDADGRYRIDDLPPIMGVVLRLGDVMRGPVSLPPMQAIEVVPGQVTTVDFGQAQPAGAVLSGHFLEVDGSPAGGRMLGICPRSGDPRTDWAGSMVDATGAFRFEHLAAGTYDVYAAFSTNGESSFLASVDLATDEQRQLDVRLVPGGLAGHAAAADGTPLGHAMIIVKVETETGRDFVAHAVADDDGNWVVRSLRPGRYWFGVYDVRGRSAAAQREGVVVEDAVVGGLDTLHVEGGSLVVRAAGRDGKPIAGAEILLVDGAGLEWPMDQYMLTGADGALSMVSVPVGAYEISVTAGGATAKGRATVTAGGSAELKLTLP